MRHSLLPLLAVVPAFGTVVASMIRIRRPRLACGAAAANASPTKSANQSPHRRKRWSSATLEISASPDRRRPRGRQSQPSIAQTIGKDQAQQVHGGCDRPSPQKSLRVTGASLKHRRPAKPGDNALPIPVHK